MLEGTTSLEENSLIPNTFCKYADLGEDAMCSKDDVIRFNKTLFSKMGDANGGLGESPALRQCFYMAWQDSAQGDISLDGYLKACGRGGGESNN